MDIKQFFIGLLALFAFTTQAYADTHANSVPAVQGYDVVSYQTGKRPIKGNGHFTAHHEGAVYIFANQANLEIFNSDPEKYAPAYGGFCAYGVSVGKKFIGDPEVWRVINGILYLNLDANIQDEWFKDVPGRIKAADDAWENIKNTPASAL